MALIKYLLVTMFVYRIFAALLFDPIFAFAWPIDFNDCEKGCNGKPLEQLCIHNCNMRRNTNMDLIEYAKLDLVRSLHI